MRKWKMRVSVALLGVLAVFALGAIEPSAADAAMKVCTGGPPSPGSACGNIGGQL